MLETKHRCNICDKMCTFYRPTKGEPWVCENSERHLGDADCTYCKKCGELFNDNEAQYGLCEDCFDDMKAPIWNRHSYKQWKEEQK